MPQAPDVVGPVVANHEQFTAPSTKTSSESAGGLPLDPAVTNVPLPEYPNVTVPELPAVKLWPDA